MIARATFLKGLLVATGGLDIWDTASPTMIRVATGDGGVATLDLETYLRGVVPLEAAASWPAAALQAQAIVARTYAVQKKTLSRGFDVVTGVEDQRYGGPAVERPASSAAVDATRGVTLRFAGGPASVFYSSCCGGHTENAAELWGHAALPYLRGVDDPDCTAAPDYRWSRTLPLDRARAALADRVSGMPVAIDLADPDASGRPRSVTIRSDGGTGVTMTVTELRKRWGADTVRSTWLHQVSVDATQSVPLVVIEGSGRGHGVGLCQWGARGMALAGADAATILTHFFPGTTVTVG